MISINRITIKNFRQFKEVDLSFSNKKGIYLFVGENGMGKSNFLNAIYWCLYDKQPFKSHHSEKNLLNEEVGASEPNAQISVSIEIEVNDKTYLISRTKYEVQDSQLKVFMKNGDDWKTTGEVNPSVLVKNFLAEKLSGYFLFDGEAVRKLYEPDNYSNNLKKGIELVSDIVLMDSASKNLDNTKSVLQSRMSADNPDIDPINEALKELEFKIKASKNELIEIEISSKKLKSDREALIKQVSKYEKYRDVQNRRTKLEAEVEDTKKEIDNINNVINRLIVDRSPFWFIKESLIEFMGEINNLLDKGELPPDIRSAFIDELLDRGVCICGTHLNDDSKYAKNLIELKNKMDPMNNKEFLIDDKAELNSMIKGLENSFINDFSSLRERRAKMRKLRDDQQRELREIHSKLENAPEEEIGDIESTIQKFDDQVDSLQQRKGVLNSTISELESKLADKKSEFSRATEKQLRLDVDSKKWKFLEEAKDKIDYIRSRIVDQVRKTISLNTDKYFKDLIWEKGKFERISFTENYEVEVYKRDGSPNYFEHLSTGELKVLSFATIKALAMISGFMNVPLFIDGPLEELGNDVQGNFLNMIPSFVENKQIFILSLGRESLFNFMKASVDKDNCYKFTRAKHGSYETTYIDKFYKQ